MATAGIGRHCRLCVILGKVGTPVAGAVFEKRVKDLTPTNHNPSPWTAYEFLLAHKPKVRSLKLSNQTWTKIFPVQSHTVKLEHWDLALLCTILTECCDLRPDIRLDIDQLRKLRNKFCHMSEPSIDDLKYRHYLVKLKVIFDRCLKEINDDVFTNEMNKMFEDLKQGNFSQVDAEEVMKQLKSMEEETKEKLTELGQNQKLTNEGIQAIMQQLTVIAAVVKDMKSHSVPATGLEIAVKNCATAKEKEISEKLVQYFEEFIKDDVEFPKLTESCQQNIRAAVFKACELLLSKGYKVVGAEEKCVFLRFNFTSMVSLISFLRECMSGELTLHLQEVEVAVRMLDGCEEVTLEAVINTEEVLAALHEIEVAISSFMKRENILSNSASSTENAAHVKIREVRLVKRKSEDSNEVPHALQLSFENYSHEYTRRLEELIENGEMDTAMQRIQEAVTGEFKTSDVRITAQLIQENETVKQEKTPSTNPDESGRKRVDDSNEKTENQSNYGLTVVTGTRGPLMTCEQDCVQYSKPMQIDEDHGACGSIHKNIVADVVEGDTDTNDLGAPPTLPVRQESLISSQESIQEINTCLTQLNIKPERTKSLPVNQTEKDEGMNESCDDEDDSSSLDSDYGSSEDETKALSANNPAPLKLREYQLELAENAILGRNTIICAETGSGKTWVTLLIVQKHLQHAGNDPRKVVFMARTGALIKQQSDRFKVYLPEFQTKLITGEDDSSRMLNMFIDDYDILCFTPQVLVNNLEDNVIKSLSEFSLLILDECHHTRGDGPYSTLMRKYLVEKAQTRKEMPQVVGLTASIGVGKSRTDMEAVEYILRVCACLDVRVLSTVERNLTALKKHINMPVEETIQLVKQRDDPCKHVIMTAMEETEELLQDISLMQPDMIELMDKQPRNRESQEYTKWTVDVMKTALLKVDDYDVTRDISSCAKYLNTYNSALEVNKLLLSRDVIKYLAEKHRLEGENKNKLTQMEKTLYINLQAVQRIMNVKGKNTENPNVRMLSDTLRKMLNEKGDQSRAMVFVNARATCRSLAAFLDKDLEQSGVWASPLFGKENRGGDDGMTENQQTEILEKFREGFYKVLVCTSVGNEGIDIPDCNIVLSYEYSGDEITKIQMKGRARKKAATAITMGSDKVVEQESINAYKASMMYRALHRVQELDPKYFDMKVTAFQNEETHKYRFKAEVEKLKKGRKSDEDYEILCGRCNTFACYVSDIRQLGHNHIVIDKAFAEKITRKVHNKPKTYDGLHTKYKMFCKKCPLDWGIIGIRDGLDCMILKIINFKFRNLRTRAVRTFKKWIDMPYNVPEIKLEDLPRLLGTEEE